jgi:hypothetical protein
VCGIGVRVLGLCGGCVFVMCKVCDSCVVSVCAFDV